MLATVDATGQPDGIPLNYALWDNPEGLEIVFHAAQEGHKIENLINNPNYSFTVVGQADIKPKEFTTHYRSVIAYGEACLEHDEVLKKQLLMLLIKKYSADFIEEGNAYIDTLCHKTAVVRLRVRCLSAKSNCRKA